MRKALIIGVGGTGQEVINNLRALVSWRRNDIDVNTQVEYLGLDTDQTKYPGANDNFIHMKVTSNQIGHVESLSQRDKDWLDDRNALPLDKGAGAVRMQGKFAFFVNLQKVTDALSRAMNKLLRDFNESSDTLTVYIAANSVSGTGSGCFVDVAYLVRKYLLDSHPGLAASIPSILMLTLPYDLVEQDNKIRNAHFALEELNHYMSFNEYSISTLSPNGRITINEKHRPFKYAYLLGGKDGSSITDREIDQMIADFLYCDLFSDLGIAAGSPRDNMRPKTNEKDGFGQYQAYSTFGISIIEYPSVQLARLSSAIYAKRAFEYWAMQSDGSAAFNFKEVLLEKADNGYKSVGTIYERLMSTATFMQAGVETECNALDCIEKLKSDFFERFENDGYESGHLDRLIAEIDEGFIASNEDIKPNVYTKGIVRNIIKRHLINLEVTPETILIPRIKEQLISHMFSGQHGIKDALIAIENAKNNLNEARNNPPDDQRSREFHKDLQRDVREMKVINADPLLSLFAFKNTPMERQKENFENNLAGYVDSKINKLVHDQSKDFLAKVVKALEDFEGKIKAFQDVVDGLPNKLQTYIDDYSRPRKINGHIINETEIMAKASDIVDEVSASEHPYQEFLLRSLMPLSIDDLLSGAETHYAIEDPRKIIETQRTRFINRFGEYKAVNEFRDEQIREVRRSGKYEDEKAGEDMIDAVKNMSRICLELPADSDEGFVFEKAIMHKELYFYENGHEITQDNFEASDNWMAQKLAPYIGHEWTDKSKGIRDSNVIIFLQERGAFPLRLWSGFNSGHWERVREDVKAQSEDLSRAYIDQKGRLDVEYIPYKPENRENHDSAKRLFLLGLTCGVLQPLGDSDFYELQGTNVFAGSGLLVPRSYKNATFRLLRNRHSLNMMQKIVEKAFDDMKDEAALLTNIANFLKDPRSFALKPELDRFEKHEAMVLLHRFVRKNDKRLELWHELNPDMPIDQASDNDLIEIELGQTSTTHITVGFYCSRCGVRIAGEKENAEKIMVQHFCQKQGETDVI